MLTHDRIVIGNSC